MVRLERRLLKVGLNGLIVPGCFCWFLELLWHWNKEDICRIYIILRNCVCTVSSLTYICFLHQSHWQIQYYFKYFVLSQRFAVIRPWVTFPLVLSNILQYKSWTRFKMFLVLFSTLVIFFIRFIRVCVQFIIMVKIQLGSQVYIYSYKFLIWILALRTWFSAMIKLK